MNLKTIGKLLQQTFREWQKENTPHMAAALAFYSLFSLTPVVMIAEAMAGMLLGREATLNQVVERIRSVAGNETAAAVRALAASPAGAASRVTATVIGVVALLLGATAVFADLQGSLNTIWKVETKPSYGAMEIVRRRLLPFFMVLGVGFFLVASLGLYAVLSPILKSFGYLLLPGYLWLFLHDVFSFLVMALLFALIYKLLPDVKIMWSDVWIGAGVTSLLFMIGRALIGLFLSSSLIRPVYGRAGSVVAFLIWIYFSAQFFFFGAEFTYVYALQVGSQTQRARQTSSPD